MRNYAIQSQSQNQSECVDAHVLRLLQVAQLSCPQVRTAPILLTIKTPAWPSVFGGISTDSWRIIEVTLAAGLCHQRQQPAMLGDDKEEQAKERKEGSSGSRRRRRGGSRKLSGELGRMIAWAKGKRGRSMPESIPSLRW